MVDGSVIGVGFLPLAQLRHFFFFFNYPVNLTIYSARWLFDFITLFHFVWFFSLSSRKKSILFFIYI